MPIPNQSGKVGFAYRQVESKPMSIAATLVLADAQKKFIDPNYQRKEKAMGLIPKGTESVFGNFPSEYKNNHKNTKTNYTVSPTSDNLEITGSTSASPPPFLHSHSGSGGLCSSLAVTKKPSVSVPPKSTAFQRQPIPETEFRRYYDRGDLPICLAHDPAAKSPIKWKIPREKLDYHHYLPLFLDGIREKRDPYRFIAVQCVYDLLEVGGGKILPTIPQLIIPLKTSLNTRDVDVLCVTIKVIQQLLNSSPLVGQALVPYYRQLLPIFSLYKDRNCNLGDKIEYSQMKRQNLGDLIDETLQMLEMKGGEDAFVNIKYMIPTYESCVLS